MQSRYSAGTNGGFLGAAVGAYAGCVLWVNYSSIFGFPYDEGGRGLAAIVDFGPIGGLLGLGLGIALALVYRGPRALIAEGRPRRRPFVIVLAVVLVAGIVSLHVAARIARLTYSDGSDGYLIFEIRAPADYPFHTDLRHIEDYEKVRATLKAGISWMRGDFQLPWREEGDWLKLAGGVEMYLRIAQRTLTLHLQSDGDRIFRIRLPSVPDPKADWSDWQKAELFQASDQAQPVPAGANDPFEIRYRPTYGFPY